MPSTGCLRQPLFVIPLPTLAERQHSARQQRQREGVTAIAGHPIIRTALFRVNTQSASPVTDWTPTAHSVSTWVVGVLGIFRPNATFRLLS